MVYIYNVVNQDKGCCVMSPIEYQAAKILGVIHAKPHDYQDALELPRNKAARYGDLMTYVGMYVQGILLINDSFAHITSATMPAYESCCNIIRKQNLAFARPIPQQVRVKFQLYLRSNLPVEWLSGFLREYRLHLFGSVMWVDQKKREYVTDFNDERFLEKTKGIWALNYAPLITYEHYADIKNILDNTT